MTELEPGMRIELGLASIEIALTALCETSATLKADQWW